LQKGAVVFEENWSNVLRRLTLVRDKEALDACFAAWVRPAAPTVIAFVNAHGMNLAAQNAAFADRLADADALLRDGSGMRLLLQGMGKDPGLNMNGTDLIPELIDAFRGQSIALWGTQDPHLSAAAAKLSSSLGPETNLMLADGFRSVDHYVREAKAQQPALIVLAMGMPKQEQVARSLREALKHPCLIICGGAILDFIADRFPRAPHWMQRVGCEWLFRFSLEPGRLFKRYMLGNPAFLARSVMFIARGRLRTRHKAQTTAEPR